MPEKLTLFEIHLDDARFGTNDRLDAETEATAADDDAGGPSVGLLVLASLVVSVVVTFVVRRIFADDESAEPALEIETDA